MRNVLYILSLLILLLSCSRHNDAERLLSQAQAVMETSPDTAAMYLDSILMPEKFLKKEKYMEYLVTIRRPLETVCNSFSADDNQFVKEFSECIKEVAQEKRCNYGMIEEYENEKEFVSQNPTLCDFGAYTDQYLKKRRALEKNIADIQAEIEQIRDIMAAMFKEQKTFEIVSKNRKKRQEKEFAEQEQKLLDEVGTNAYIKKHQ